MRIHANVSLKELPAEIDETKGRIPVVWVKYYDLKEGRQSGVVGFLSKTLVIPWPYNMMNPRYRQAGVKALFTDHQTINLNSWTVVDIDLVRTDLLPGYLKYTAVMES